MKLLLSLIVLCLSLSVQASPKKGFYCTAYDIIDVSFSGQLIDGEWVVKPGDVHVAIIDVPYLIPAEQVKMAFTQKADGNIFHLEAAEPGQEEPFLVIDSIDEVARTSMDFKGVRLYKTPTYCNFGS